MNIMKSFEFCYGHRVWNQVLNNGAECKCRRIHGHNGKVDVILSGEILTRGMLIDFNELQFVKQLIDTYVDHRFIVDREDPLLVKWLKNKELMVFSGNFCSRVVGEFEDAVEQEFFSSLVIVDFVPTAENLACWMFKLVLSELDPKITLKTIRWWESNQSYAEVG